MRRAWLAAALLLAGCTGPTYPVAPAAQPAPTAPQPTAPAPVAAPRATPAPARSVSRDCGAKDLQHLVGRPRSEIPVPVDPNRQRVACTTCPAAETVDPGRLNFLFDAETGRIREIRCG